MNVSNKEALRWWFSYIWRSILGALGLGLATGLVVGLALLLVKKVIGMPVSEKFPGETICIGLIGLLLGLGWSVHVFKVVLEKFLASREATLVRTSSTV
jgi:hypothetical protein